MYNRIKFIDRIFSISTDQEFNEAALELFRYQSVHNPVYNKYLELLGKDLSLVSKPEQIPFLPVSFFKRHRVVTGKRRARLVFESSGTGGDTPSRHYICDPGLYMKSFIQCFGRFYGDIGEWCIIALLPSYLERSSSSLVYMAEKLIDKSSCRQSGFYLHNIASLAETLQHLEEAGKKTLLLGVSFALLDLVESHKLSLKHTVIMETGGMKGRRKELTREELHSIIKSRTGLREIHSEYGMTELMSQAYGTGGKFSTPPWMKVMIRDGFDPFSYIEEGRSGGVNIIDLANVDSCSFLETSDLGRMLPGGKFEILGRFDNSDIRGCSLLAG